MKLTMQSLIYGEGYGTAQYLNARERGQGKDVFTRIYRPLSAKTVTKLKMVKA